jgi:ring-1,2-phenylacetyl-CoA epoxidase subunit PaaC
VPAVPATSPDAAAVEAVLRVADTLLVHAQRLTEWVGHAPTLEEEVALANVALDQLGQATMLLERAGELEAALPGFAGEPRDADALAMLRSEGEYHNLLLAELPRGDFALTMLRVLVLGTWLAEVWNGMAGSRDEQLAGIAGKAAKECAYHVEHAADWVERLGHGTTESRRRLGAAMEELQRFFGEAFLDDDVDRAAAEAGVVVPLPSELEAAWRARTGELLGRGGLALAAPDEVYAQRGGRQGRHTEHLGYLLAELQHLQRAHPGATW